tara:strand:- start:30 stop:419 length:390 start_codon:yes stop_codon:yes gene_type:complete
MNTRVQQVVDTYNFTRNSNVNVNEIVYTLESYKKEVDVYTDNVIYSMSKHIAQYLLDNLDHTPLSSNQANKVLHLSKKLYNHGMGSCWSDKPVVINLSTLTIEDGVTRLCAVAEFVSNRGVMLPIKLIK